MCGVTSRFANVRNGWSSGNGSWSKTSLAAPAIFQALSATNWIRLDHDRSARRVYQAGWGFHERELRGTDQTARPIAEDHMYGNDIRPPEQFFLANQLGARCRCAQPTATPLFGGWLSMPVTAHRENNFWRSAEWQCERGLQEEPTRGLRHEK